ncbi:MAG: cell division protein FtsZ [Verrucomicrobia bacterium]|nr:cell division protein FtsZ [Verrucomicrobiota bacterium]
MIEITSRTGSGTARNIKIVGIGGAGANVLDRLALDGVAPASLIAANSEAQALAASVAGEKIQLGLAATRGLGAGGDPDLGRCAAEEAAGEIRAALEGAEAVFVVAGLGGGTGSGAAPLVAELARETGAMVIAVVTLPFTFEGKRRAAQAADALAALQQHADAVVCFENDRMGEAAPPRAGIQTAFVAADQTLSQSILALAALLNRSGLIHLGMDDLATVLRDTSARCLFGYGEADGSNRSFDALARALKNPLMDKGRMLSDCETVLVQVSGGPDLTLDEVQLLMEEFNRFVSDHTRILFGAAVDPELAGRLAVTVLSSLGEARPIAARPRTPFSEPEKRSAPPRALRTREKKRPATRTGASHTRSHAGTRTGNPGGGNGSGRGRDGTRGD